jgi:hypothetical protein
MALRLFVIFLLACAEAAQPQATKRPGMQRSEIVFVCKHGAALSVVAAAYFNRRAQQKHLHLHAIARGTSPRRILLSALAQD